MWKLRSKSPVSNFNIENIDSNISTPSTSDEVTLLKHKLVETHRKLLDQLDFNREQEMRILELTRELETKKDKGGSYEPNRADLEAMRTRVLAEMLEKNKARDELKAVTARLLEKEQLVSSLQ